MPVGSCLPRRGRGAPLIGSHLPQATKKSIEKLRNLTNPKWGIIYCTYALCYCYKEYIVVTLIVFSTCSVVVVHGGNSPRLDIWWTIGCIDTHM